MNILIVTQYFWPENFRINDLALGLLERGHGVTVLTGIPNYPDGRFFSGYGFFTNMRQDYHGIEVIRAPLIPRGKGGGFRLLINYLSFALCASVLAPLLCRGKLDLIFVPQYSPVTVGLPALVLKKLRSVPIMFWIQDLWPDSLLATGAVRSPRVLNMVGLLVRFIYRGCDRILVQSKAFFESIEKFGVANEKILYFPNSAEELYRPVTVEADVPKRAGLPTGFRVMFAGNIGVAQDFPTILDAAENLKCYPDIHWVIIGDGRMRQWVETQVQERGLTETVHLLGRHPMESMPRYFSLADVLLATLKKEPIFAFTIPSKVQSYLACARPIIAALDGEGARVIQEAGAGLTPPAENPEALAESVLALYRMSGDERQAMGARGRQYFIEHFERDKLLARLDGWMEDLKGKVEQCVS